MHFSRHVSGMIRYSEPMSGSGKCVISALFEGIHSPMDPNLWSEVNDAARTGIEAVQAFTALRHGTGVPDHQAEVADDAVVVPGASTEVPAVPRAVHGRKDVVEHLVAEARRSHMPQVLAGAGGMGKSTIARLAARRVRDRDPRRRIWWISAAN
jgi:UDP-N-acetylmuramoylalanine-D-glutamate ligase